MAPPQVMKSAARSALGVFFEYDTPRIVHIRSKKVGLFNRFLQLSILAYIIGYAIVYKKGYQEFENVQSAVTTKVKGIAFSNGSIPGIGTRTWDVADYVIPPQENDAFFVMTNVVVTPGQTQTGCAEDPGVTGAICQTNADCEQVKGTILPSGSGPVTGECVPSDVPGSKEKVCQIFGWCPLENDKMQGDSPVLENAKNFTVFIKNNIEFPRFGVSRRNILGFYNDTALKTCRWKRGDPKLKFCPIFVLDDIARDAGVTFENMMMEGGVMQIVIDWTCNLDYSVEDCVPEYTFRRLDKGDYSVSRGFNFRFADRYSVFNESTGLQLYRNLYKAYGVRFLVTVQGKAGKFSIVPLLLNIGSGMALLGVATIICDIMVLYVLKAKNFYRDKKYLDVKGQDAFEVLEEEAGPGEQMSEGSTNSVSRRNLTASDGGAAP
ncbi:purinergic ATP P2X4 receptor subunit 1 isoform X1 [Aplysia californica]|uniref:Purinergic ATP P2X4 receptor subunit 1 isoform X1 n=1 Tax=Aplysia californica TaxID=6500 RepID=A0ABM1A7F5_APLCA|nr:purinergic ATP P2X4 receptor subunit 1 isoform X1 [Aplysia californica]